MRDFWKESGFHLLERDSRGHLAVTDDFLRAYFARPELRPIAEACPAERALHAELLADPRQPVTADRLAALADADARDNYRYFLGFRDRLLAAGTVEACYLRMFRDGAVGVPPLFVDHLVHVILRNILDGAEDALRPRAGELLFREQRVTIEEGAILLADAETVAMRARNGGASGLDRLLIETGTPPVAVTLDILRQDNAELYWARSERYDTVLEATFTGAGLDALCRVLEAWVAHFVKADVAIQPVQQITDERWVWHVGLDAEGSALLNDLYNGEEVSEDRRARLLSLFRLDFDDPGLMRPDIAGRPVYLAMAMTPDNSLRLKPQNLLCNLPLAEAV